MDVKNTLIPFVRHELLGGQTVGEDNELLSDGMVDSVGMVRLVAFIEDQFGFQVPPEDFIIDHFRTINSLSEYLSTSLESTRSSPGKN